MIRTIQTWVTRQAQRNPRKPAVVMEHDGLSYGQLEETSNRLARALRESGCQSGDRVCLLLPKSPLTVAAILGVLKAGCIYVPLDLSSPAARLARILATCQPSVLLAATASQCVLEELLRASRVSAQTKMGWLDAKPAESGCFEPSFRLADLATLPGNSVEALSGSNDAAYIMFTSGSTGNPKGVVITHSNVAHFVEWAVSHFEITENDRLSGHSAFHFDLSVFDIFGAFAAGAQVHLVSPAANCLAAALAAFIRDSALSQWFSVPSALAFMAKADAVRPHDFPALKRVLWCGEVFPVPALRYWMDRCPHAVFTNLYGPTETTVASSYYTVTKCPGDNLAAIPIGKPCRGESLYVLDDNMAPVEPGVTGNLYIGGSGVSPGYYHDPQTTRKAFLPNAVDGAGGRLYKTGDLAKVGENSLIYFVGRCDSQIKSRGYRIELGEIAAALASVDGLQDSAVVAISGEGVESSLICCAYVSLPGREISPALLRRELRRLLPAYMLPARWAALRELPRNANGKTDTPKLREYFALGMQPDTAAASNAIERHPVAEPCPVPSGGSFVHESS